MVLPGNFRGKIISTQPAPQDLNVEPVERRRSQRLRLQVPLFLRGFDCKGAEFLDLTKSLDISATGAFLVSRRLLGCGQVIRITIPVSAEPISALIPVETPPIEARVCRVTGAGDVRLVGVEFVKPLD